MPLGFSMHWVTQGVHRNGVSIYICTGGFLIIVQIGMLHLHFIILLNLLSSFPSNVSHKHWRTDDVKLYSSSLHVLSLAGYRLDITAQ